MHAGNLHSAISHTAPDQAIYNLPAHSGDNSVRTTHQIFPQNGNTFTPTNNNVITLQIPQLQGGQLIDPNSVKLSYNINLTNPTTGSYIDFVQPKTSDITFQRMRLYSSSAVLEDINDYDNLCVTMNSLTGEDKQNTLLATNASFATTAVSSSVSSAGGLIVSQTVKSGLLSSIKMLPIGMFPGGLYLELTLNANGSVCKAGGQFTVTDVRLDFDTVYIPKVSKQIEDHYNSGKSIKLYYQTWDHQQKLWPTGSSTNILQCASNKKSLHGFLISPRPLANIGAAAQNSYARTSANTVEAQWKTPDANYVPSQPLKVTSVSAAQVVQQTRYLLKSVTETQALTAGEAAGSRFAYGQNFSVLPTHISGHGSGSNTIYDLTTKHSPVVPEDVSVDVFSLYDAVCELKDGGVQKFD